ncbi:MAG: ATP-dependent DNA ligase [Chloroflexota bacterium]
MIAFSQLYARLDETNKTNAKVEALVGYFKSAPPADAVWAIYFLSGNRPRRAVSSRMLSEWAAAEVGIPEWLFRESYDAVGDIAETVTLILPDDGQPSDLPLHRWIEERLLPLQKMEEEERRVKIVASWRELTRQQRFVWNKLLVGGFRVGVSRQLVTRALAEVAGIDQAVIAHRLMGNWEPTAGFYQSIFEADTADSDISRPYPFYLAYPLELEATDKTELGREMEGVLGKRDEWQVEWKWDGIRAQMIRRKGEHFLWSRGEDLITDSYPELIGAADSLPDGTVLDGELLGWKAGQVLPFSELQRRLGRKKVGKKMLAEVPIVLMAYDLLEWEGDDWRPRPLDERRAKLEALVAEVDHPHITLSNIAPPALNWDELTILREESRSRQVEGFMLKRRSSIYQVGRTRGDWWKWKIDPYTVDAVMIYAQRGSGRRASLYTDYTFAVWNEAGELVPFAKAYSGLTDKEIRVVDRFIKANTVEKFGPVRSVKPELVFEIAFESIQLSKRHKSGIAVRFPRILRQRTDKKPEEADTLMTVKALLDPKTS